MKKLIFGALLLCNLAIVSICTAQTTNYFWSAGKTSNEITAAITARLGTNNAYAPGLVSNVAPFKTLYFGLTTNTPVMQEGTTNWWWFTNGVLTLITNSPT